jgi:hypothetical protein
MRPNRLHYDAKSSSDAGLAGAFTVWGANRSEGLDSSAKFNETSFH